LEYYRRVPIFSTKINTIAKKSGLTKKSNILLIKVHITIDKWLKISYSAVSIEVVGAIG
jgi:hypothetical protein